MAKLGLLKGQLFCTGWEENIIKAKNPNEKDSAWYKVKFSDGVNDIVCTCGSEWKIDVGGKEVTFLATTIKLFQKYDITVDADYSSGYCKLKLRTFKCVEQAQAKQN